MSGKRAKRLMEQARLAAMDGSVVKSHEYKKLKKKWVNPHYAPVVVLNPTKPGFAYLAKYNWQRDRVKKKTA